MCTADNYNCAGRPTYYLLAAGGSTDKDVAVPIRLYNSMSV